MDYATSKPLRQGQFLEAFLYHRHRQYKLKEIAMNSWEFHWPKDQETAGRSLFLEVLCNWWVARQSYFNNKVIIILLSKLTFISSCFSGSFLFAPHHQTSPSLASVNGFCERI